MKSLQIISGVNCNSNEGSDYDAEDSAFAEFENTSLAKTTAEKNIRKTRKFVHANINTIFRKNTLETEIYKLELAKMKELYDKYEVGGSMTEENFLIGFRDMIAGSKISDEELRNMFARIGMFHCFLSRMPRFGCQGIHQVGSIFVIYFAGQCGPPQNA